MLKRFQLIFTVDLLSMSIEGYGAIGWGGGTKGWLHLDTDMCFCMNHLPIGPFQIWPCNCSPPLNLKSSYIGTSTARMHWFSIPWQLCTMSSHKRQIFKSDPISDDNLHCLILASWFLVCGSVWLIEFDFYLIISFLLYSWLRS